MCYEHGERPSAIFALLPVKYAIRRRTFDRPVKNLCKSDYISVTIGIRGEVSCGFVTRQRMRHFVKRA